MYRLNYKRRQYVTQVSLVVQIQYSIERLGHEIEIIIRWRKEHAVTDTIVLVGLLVKSL